MSKKQERTGREWLVWSGILALVSTLGWLVYSLDLSRSKKPVAVSLLTVERGMIKNTINEIGTVELSGQQTLKSADNTAVEKVLVKPGDTVQAGQLLLTLRNGTAAIALSSALLVGVGAAFPPALRASQLDPVKALHSK